MECDPEIPLTHDFSRPLISNIIEFVYFINQSSRSTYHFHVTSTGLQIKVLFHGNA